MDKRDPGYEQDTLETTERHRRGSLMPSGRGSRRLRLHKKNGFWYTTLKSCGIRSVCLWSGERESTHPNETPLPGVPPPSGSQWKAPLPSSAPNRSSSQMSFSRRHCLGWCLLARPPCGRPCRTTSIPAISQRIVRTCALNPPHLRTAPLDHVCPASIVLPTHSAVRSP